MGDNAAIADEITRLHSREAEVLKGAHSRVKADFSSVILNTDFAAIGAAEKDITRRFMSTSRSAQRHYQSSPTALPSETASELQRLGGELTTALMG
ncbi:MAG: hypothetical protein ACPG80_03095 [Rickettsiales bacterium]